MTMGHYASEMDGSSGPSAGPMPAAKPPGPHNFNRFDALMNFLQEWREDDHADAITMHRSQIIEIIESVKALREPQ
jgi:hypothetical protein